MLIVTVKYFGFSFSRVCLDLSVKSLLICVKNFGRKERCFALSKLARTDLHILAVRDAQVYL